MRILNLRALQLTGSYSPDYLPDYMTYIGRGSPFGNPFKIGPDGTRDEVIQKYKRYFWDKINRDSDFYFKVLELEGQDLVCWCAPLPCHGDVIKAWFEAGRPLRDAEALLLGPELNLPWTEGDSDD